MSVAEDVEEQRLRATKYPKLHVLTGGKGPPDDPTDGHNWLGEYVPGTTFVSMRRSSKDCDYELFHVVFTTPEVFLLQWVLPDGKIWDKHVDPVGFSKLMKPGVILGIHKPEASKEDTDDERNRTNRLPDLV